MTYSKYIVEREIRAIKAVRRVHSCNFVWQSKGDINTLETISFFLFLHLLLLLLPSANFIFYKASVA
jgi:hypothetical protein